MTLRNKVLAECEAWANDGAGQEEEEVSLRHPSGWVIWKFEHQGKAWYEFVKDGNVGTLWPYDDSCNDEILGIVAEMLGITINNEGNL